MIQILNETPQYCVVNKEPGWLSVPGRGHLPVLSRILETQLGKKVWPVHRLDRDTSGVILFAMTAEFHRQANLWFEKKQVKKNYWALVQGIPLRPLYKVNQPIEGVTALTQFEVLEKWRVAAWVKAVPLTGKRHQIRIHSASQGHPLLGDVEYGGKKELISRVALHAFRLELPGGIVFEAPAPEDFLAAIQKCKEKEGS